MQRAREEGLLNNLKKGKKSKVNVKHVHTSHLNMLIGLQRLNNPIFVIKADNSTSLVATQM